MSITITIKQSTIKAVSYAMAVSDIRYYLNGMLLQHNGEETRLVATDGHRMNAARIEHKDALVSDPIEIILPDTLVKTIIKAKAPRHDKIKEIVLTIDGSTISAALPDGTSTVAKAVDGKFPDYSRVIPDSFSGECAQFNPEYVLDAVEALRAYWENKKIGVAFNHNGTGVAGFSVDGFMSLVMPWRADGGKDSTAWAKAEMRKPEVLPEVTASCGAEIAAMIDPNGALQAAGLLAVA